MQDLGSQGHAMLGRALNVWFPCVLVGRFLPSVIVLFFLEVRGPFLTLFWMACPAAAMPCLGDILRFESDSMQP